VKSLSYKKFFPAKNFPLCVFFILEKASEKIFYDHKKQTAFGSD